MSISSDSASVLTSWGAGVQLIFAVLILTLRIVVAAQGIPKLLEKAPAAEQ